MQIILFIVIALVAGLLILNKTSDGLNWESIGWYSGMSLGVVIASLITLAKLTPDPPAPEDWKTACIHMGGYPATDSIQVPNNAPNYFETCKLPNGEVKKQGG